ncbi:MAG TPA: hypothetical protein VEA59_03650 [Patescibacteria group bacterium]|nr:hypothetical protein [Patescibacteria group bacterium]
MTIAYRLYITFLTVLVALFTWAVATSEPRQGYAFMHALICLFVVMTDLIVNNSVYQRHFYPIEQEAKRRLASLGLPVREVRVRNLITHWRPAVIAWLMNVAMLAYCVYFYFVNELPKRELMSRNTHLFILGINALGLLATYTLWWDLSRILKKSKR